MSRIAALGQKMGWWLAIVGAIFLFTPILLQLTGIPFYRQVEYSDLLIAHLPNAKFIHHALSEWSQIPLWNPTLYAGAPFAADPLSGMTYLPNWLAVAFPIPITFNLLLLLHTCWSALGCYSLARRSGQSQTAGVVFGLAFAGTPKLFAHLGLGHISLIYAVSWTPWLLVCVAAAIGSLSQERTRAALLTGGVLGFIFLADPRWSLPSLLLACGFGLHRWLLLPIEQRGNRAQIIRTGLLMSGISLGIAALLAIPLFEFLQLSTRADLTSDASNVLALEWSHLLGLFHPILAQAEQVTYLGVTILILALMGILSGKRGRVFWGVVFFVSVLLSLGSATPIYPFLARLLPGAGFLRVPARTFFLAAFAAAALAGYGIESLLDNSKRNIKIERVRLAYLSLTLMIMLINVGFALMRIGLWSHQLITSIFAVAVAILIELNLRGRIRATTLGSIWLIVIVLDLLWVDWTMIRMVPYRQVLEEQRVVADSLSQPNGEARIFSPSYAIPHLAAVNAKLELADGVNPLQLTHYYNYLQRATGFEAAGYGVTLPPFPSGDPKQPWEMELDSELLSRLNISHVVSDYKLEDSSLTYVDSMGGVDIYALEETRPRAWVDLRSDGNWAVAEVASWTPNRIQIRAEGPGILVLSEISYPGWQVELDGQRAELHTYDELFRAVTITQGEHLVTFSFQPQTVYLGMALFGLTVIIGVILGWKR